MIAICNDFVSKKVHATVLGGDGNNEKGQCGIENSEFVPQPSLIQSLSGNPSIYHYEARISKIAQQENFILW